MNIQSLDEISRGHWLLVTRVEPPEIHGGGYYILPMVEGSYTGCPWLVLEVSPPFILCKEAVTGDITSFDWRKTSFTRANRKYVNQFFKHVRKKKDKSIEHHVRLINEHWEDTEGRRND